MFFEIIAVLLLGGLAVFGLYEFIILIEQKLLADMIAERTITLVPMKNNSQNAEFLVRSINAKFSKTKVSKSNTIMVIDCGMDDETRDIIEGLTEDMNNLVYVNKNAVNDAISLRI